jgi:large subunit ribosomal protein L22
VNLHQQEILKDTPARRLLNKYKNVPQSFKLQALGFRLKKDKMEALAKLKNYPTSPRKMRLLADEIRGLQVEKALALLEHHPQHSSTPLYKLLWSAVKNWESKNEGKSAADAGLLVKTIFVDGARVLKRMRPAPQGRGYRVRKRSNHVTLIVDEKIENKK